MATTRGGRSTSVPWSRLKPINQDPLESMGLPSKGDNRLLDYKTQERYYTKIVERYMAFCTTAGKSDELLRRLANLDISSTTTQSTTCDTSQPPQPFSTSHTNPKYISPPPISSSTELATITMSMRKLREGIVSSRRIDPFSTQVYIFCIRLSILTKAPDSYHPALLHLLRRMHPIHPLSTTELHEFAGYMILDLVCRQNQLAQAYEMRNKYKIRDAKIDAVLRALVRDDFVLFWRVRGSVDGYKAKLMEWAEDGVRRRTLKCLGRAYLGIELKNLEALVCERWDVLVGEYGVGWLLEGSKVVIRKPKTK